MSELGPILQIDLSSPQPVYGQIVGHLRSFLVHGELAAGDRLPTVRQLAVDLGVHHNTVAEAYRILAEEGWLDLRRGRGATVLDRPGPEPSAESRRRFIRHLEELAAKALADGVPRGAVAEQLTALVRKLETA